MSRRGTSCRAEPSPLPDLRPFLSVLSLLGLVAIASAPGSRAAAAEAAGPARQAYRAYAERIEGSFVAGAEAAEAGSEPFLYIEHLERDARERAWERLRDGDVPVFEIEPRSADGDDIDLPDASLHHWIAAVLVPGASVDDVLDLLQDYDRHGEAYAPDITEGEILDRQGQDFTVRHRFRIAKVVTVVFDTVHQVRYRRLGPGRAYSVSRTTSVREVRDAGSPAERALPEGEGRDYLRAISSYWRYAAVEGGTIVEAQSVTLAGELPALFGLFVSIGEVPRDILVSMLRNTRRALAPASRDGAGGASGRTPGSSVRDASRAARRAFRAGRHCGPADALGTVPLSTP